MVVDVVVPLLGFGRHRLILPARRWSPLTDRLLTERVPEVCIDQLVQALTHVPH
jgi:hypothetical protein